MARRNRKPEKDSVRIGNCMRIARENLHLNQDAVAAAIGMKRNALSKAELGVNDMTFTHFYRLVQVLERDPADIMFGWPRRLDSGEEVIVREPRMNTYRGDDDELHADLLRMEDHMRRLSHYQRSLLLKVAEGIESTPLPGEGDVSAADDADRSGPEGQRSAASSPGVREKP